MNARFQVVVASMSLLTLPSLKAEMFIPSCDFGLNNKNIYHACSPFEGTRSQILIGSGTDNDPAASEVIPSFIKDIVVSHPAGELVAISDSTVRIFGINIGDGKLNPTSGTPVQLDQNAKSVAFNVSGSTFAVGDEGGKMNVFVNNSLNHSFFPFANDSHGKNQSVDFIAFVADDEIVAATKFGSSVLVCDLMGNVLKGFDSPSGGREISSVAANTNGLVVIAGAEGNLSVYSMTNTTDRRQLWSTNGLGQETKVAISSDGKVIAAAWSNSETITFFDSLRAYKLGTGIGHAPGAACIRFNDQRRTASTGPGDCKATATDPVFSTPPTDTK
jgi:WD40 repeat protein